MKKIISSTMLFLAMLGNSYVALADARYVMAIRNNTTKTIVGAIDPSKDGGHSSCVTLANSSRFNTFYVIRPNEARYIGFWRSVNCSGEQGWLAIQASGGDLPARTSTTDDYQQFWFDNDGGFEKHGNNSRYQNTLETFSQTLNYSRSTSDLGGGVFTTCYPTYPLVLHINDTKNVTIERALQNSCYSKASVQALLSQFLSTANYTPPVMLGSDTNTALSNLLTGAMDQWATKTAVQALNTRVYRAPTMAGEQVLLNSGQLTSKFSKYYGLATSPEAVANFMRVNGPDLTTLPTSTTSVVSDLTKALQMIAVRSSDNPRQWFNSTPPVPGVEVQ